MRQVRAPVAYRNAIRLTSSPVSSMRGKFDVFFVPLEVAKRVCFKINKLAIPAISSLGISTSRPIFNKALAQEQLDLGTEYLNKGSIDLVRSGPREHYKVCFDLTQPHGHTRPWTATIKACRLLQAVR